MCKKLTKAETRDKEKFISGRDTTKKPVNKRIDSHTATYLLQNQEALTDEMICRCLFC